MPSCSKSMSLNTVPMTSQPMDDRMKKSEPAVACDEIGLRRPPVDVVVVKGQVAKPMSLICKQSQPDKADLSSSGSHFRLQPRGLASSAGRGTKRAVTAISSSTPCAERSSLSLLSTASRDFGDIDSDKRTQNSPVSLSGTFCRLSLNSSLPGAAIPVGLTSLSPFSKYLTPPRSESKRPSENSSGSTDSTFVAHKRAPVKVLESRPMPQRDRSPSASTATELSSFSTIHPADKEGGHGSPHKLPLGTPPPRLKSPRLSKLTLTPKSQQNNYEVLFSSQLTTDTLSKFDASTEGTCASTTLSQSRHTKSSQCSADPTSLGTKFIKSRSLLRRPSSLDSLDEALLEQFNNHVVCQENVSACSSEDDAFFLISPPSISTRVTTAGPCRPKQRVKANLMDGKYGFATGEHQNSSGSLLGMTFVESNGSLPGMDRDGSKHGHGANLYKEECQPPLGLFIEPSDILGTGRDVVTPPLSHGATTPPALVWNAPQDAACM